MTKRSLSDYLGVGPGAFFNHYSALSESGYNYYGFMHRCGLSYIMRQNISTSEVTYAYGGWRLGSWASRATLTYTDIFSVVIPTEE